MIRSTLRRSTPFAILALAAGASGQLAFTEATVEAGLSTSHSPPERIGTGIMVGGGATADFNADGHMDLFVVGGGLVPDRLFLNDGDGTFTDRATEWGVDRMHLGGGSACGDVDNDGLVDLFVVSQGPPESLQPGHHMLYMNVAHTSFVDNAASAGVSTTSPILGDGYGAAFGDIELDGDLDLFVAAWFLDHNGNTLFENDGSGVFSKITEANIGDLTGVRGFSPRFVDMDGDRYPELLLVADFGTSRYYANDGDGTFTDMTAASGTGLDSNGMGTCVGDFDEDGRLDWYVTSILGTPDGSGNMLYRGLGNHSFDEISVAAGVNDGDWGWGTVAEDFDLDGWLDIAETNGWYHGDFSGDPSYLWINDRAGGFIEQAAATGFVHTGQGRGLLAFDADGDGDRELVVIENDGPLLYFRNDQTSHRHWLNVRLDNGGEPDVAPHGYGAKVTVVTTNSTRSREVCGGSSYVAAVPVEAHFGLGNAELVDALRVAWPDGTKRLIRDVAVDQALTVTCCAGWRDEGGGLSGSAGAPVLVGDGSLVGGEPFTIRLVGAAPSASAWLVIGLAEALAPFKGGVMVPSNDIVLPTVTDGAGGLFVAGDWPVDAAPGSRVWLQAWISDAGGPVGLAASNGLRATTP